MTVSFDTVEQAITNLTTGNGKFANLMEKQSKTVAGSWSNIVDAMTRAGAGFLGVSADGEVAVGSLYSQIQSAMAGISSFLSDNQQTITVWGRAIIGSFSAIARTLYNTVTMIAKIITAPIVMAVGGVRDAISTIRSWLSGDFTVDTTNIKASWDTVTEGIVEDATDMASGWLDAYDSVNEANTKAVKATGELTKEVNNAGTAVNKKAKEAAEQVEKLSEKITDAYDKIKDENKDYIKSLKELKSELKDDLKSIKSDYNESEATAATDLATNIAQSIVDAQNEIVDLKEKMAETTDTKSRYEYAQQISELETYLENHKSDIETYADEIASIKAYESMDEIEQLRYTYAQEKTERQKAYEEEVKERKEQYKQDMKDLKEAHEEKLKELKKALKKVQKELAKFVSSDEYKKTTGVTSIASVLSTRATGGLISKNTPYLVGEKGPELIVPSGSGRVVTTQNLQAASQSQGGSQTVINVDIGTYAGSYSEKRKLGQEILNAINQTRAAKGLASIG